MPPPETGRDDLAPGLVHAIVAVLIYALLARRRRCCAAANNARANGSRRRAPVMPVFTLPWQLPMAWGGDRNGHQIDTHRVSQIRLATWSRRWLM